jgi:hypothetical protein
MQGVVDALGVTYGYEIYKIYKDAFEPIDLRSIYYHLSQGVSLGEFVEVGIKSVKGKFTWGEESIRKYYVLGPNATQGATDDLHILVKTLDLEYRDLGEWVVWGDVLKEKFTQYSEQFEALVKKQKQKKDGVTRQALQELEKRIDLTLAWLSGRVDVKQIIELKKRVEAALKKV